MSKKFYLLVLVLLFAAITMAQTPVPMYTQTNLTYTENFDSIASWTDNFTSGTGANRFIGLPAQGSATIPDATRITHVSDIWRTSLSSGGIQKGTVQLTPTLSMVFLATGTTNNSNATGVDFFMDFTGVDAGTLSFDWNELGNSTGNRNGTFTVYASTNGTTFTELTAAAVTVTNNVFTSGSITNVALPASFNNSATARLRLYYYNSAGGSTGSRPKFNIDNWKITAVPNIACSTPAAQPTNLVFGTITDTTIAASFTAASPVVDEYLVVASTNPSLTSLPVDGVNYTIGDNIGDGTLVSKSFSNSFVAKSLNASTQYFFFIFSSKTVCTGGPKYLTASPLTGNATTNAGFPPCTTPAAQAANLTFPSVGINSISGSFTPAVADEYLVIRSLSSSLSNNPANGLVYNIGDVIGNGVVVQRNNTTTFTANGLSPNTQYYFYIFTLNSLQCSLGPAYNLLNPLTGNQTTLPLPNCTTPSVQPTNLTFNASANAISGAFTPASAADNYLVIRSLSPSLSSTPVDNTDYNVGDNLGGGVVIANSPASSFLTVNLLGGTTYYFFIFSSNKNCSGGTKYLTGNPLTGNIATAAGSGNNFYFGNLHSHSDYSDGNQDNPGFTPTDNYAYAKNSLCMDFLGISEHNHFTSPNNPGTLLANYHLGSTQANTFTANNPGFIALYGMEWGVISNGGHVIIYGNGMDNLFGWETNVGGVSGNNYDVFVQKSDYTGANGLFKTVNDNIATNTFASLAHPNSTDFGNIMNNAYNAVADSAIATTAIESGPATSLNTTYSDPASSFNYLWYYLTLLSKGYKLGAVVDHDNHNTTFGRTTYSRTGVVAPSLTKANIIAAYRNMNVYATQDCDTKVEFSINTKPMGSTLSDRYAPNIYVNLTDATTSLAGAKIKLMYGVPGSGLWAVKIDSVFGSTMNVVDNNIANGTTGYYFLDITNGAARIITSPIWYTRNDGSGPIPVKLGSFNIEKQSSAVKLTWHTEQEISSSYFSIEKSADGRNWNEMTRVSAAGFSNTRKDYASFDNAPFNGINYYRLKLVDRDGKFEYSVVRSLLFTQKTKVQVSPNPAKGFINVFIAKNNLPKPATVTVTSANGKKVFEVAVTHPSLQINVQHLPKGIYMVSVTDNEGLYTTKILIL